MSTTLSSFRTIVAAESHGGAVARITLSEGKGNILTGEMMRELRLALANAAANPDTKIILLTGEGRHFSFGASVEEHTRDKAAAMLREFHGLILDVARLDVPILSRVTGACLGGALELVMAGSLVFAEAGATFGQPEINLGVFAPPASILLPLRIGYGRAEELLITGESITASRALVIGLVNRVFDTVDALDAGCNSWIEEHILLKSAAAIRCALHAERERMVDTLATMLPRMERYYVDNLMATADANEGIAAFLERRPPVWTNS